MSNGPYYRGECCCGEVALLATGTALAIDSQSGQVRWRQEDLQLAQGLLDERDMNGQKLAWCTECGQQIWRILPGRGDVETPLSLWPFD